MFYNSSNNFDYNDCTSHGACSVSPNISSMREFMFILLKQTAFYLSKLKTQGVEEPIVENDVISQTAFIDAMKDLSEARILNSFSKQYINLVKTRKEYLTLCKERNLKCEDLKNLIKLSPKTNLSDILMRGDREFIQKYKQNSFDKKYHTEILSGVIKSVCTNIIKLGEYGEEYKEANDTAIKALSTLNRPRILPDKIRYYIDLLAQCDLELIKHISICQSNFFGKIERTEVSCSTRPHKAIMVSGSDLNDLSHLLNAVKGQDIDVYTNGNLLCAHAFSYFKSFENLKGHFGSGVYNTILDFATFPGAILLTQNESQNIEYLYRGRLFTTDEIPPSGVAQILDNDFTPLIESANQAKGFAKGRERNPEITGFDEDSCDELFESVIAKNPEKIIIIGFSNFSVQQQAYFAKFFQLVPDNWTVISFSHKCENSVSINIGNNYPIMYKVLHKLFEKIPLDSDKLVFFLTKCDVNSVSNIINLKNRGAKRIFLSDCPPVVINPTVLKAFSDIYGIKSITNPDDDFNEIKSI